MSDDPIAEYAMLSDCHGSGLVHRSGAIDWLCMGRFDAPSIFARLLDERAGSWRIQPSEEFESTRRYLDRSMVLETTFSTDSGVVVLTDAMDIDADESGHDLGAGAAQAVLRQVRCTEGSVAIEIEYVPRPEYGLIAPMLMRTEEGILARGGVAVLHLSSSVELEIEDASAHREVTLQEGDQLCFALQHARSWEGIPNYWPEETVCERLDKSVDAWQTWAEMHQAYEGPWEELVHKSGRVLQAMTFAPTGAFVAAPTTSLPEEIGGERNWDYRYTWVRDSSLILDALWVAACPDEADTFFDFIAHAALSQFHRSEDMQIMFGVGGEHDLTERQLSHLDGWRDSRPVRVGNGAWDQRQLDVYGELLLAAHRLREHLTDLPARVRRFLAHLADIAADRWQEKDQGIWEIRGEPRHFLHSKLMCWVALDRAIDMAEMIEGEEKVDDWRDERERIRETILSEGWDDDVGAFTQSFEGHDLDASSLMIPIVGFLPGDDERVVATIEATEEHLTDDHGLVYRYRGDDGLPGDEGTFLLCTFWLAHACALAGRSGRAREICERGLQFVNDVGLLSEEVDPETGELLGNFPQSFSHIGLVNAAWAIHRGEQGDLPSSC